MTSSKPTPVPKPAKRRAKYEQFVLLPKPVLKHPPIAHRGRPTRGLLTVFETALATGIVALARQAWHLARYRHSLKAGRAAVSDRDEIGAEVARCHRDDIEYGFNDVMADAYITARANAIVPPAIKVTTSPSALLRAAALSAGGKNQAILGAALSRLRGPVQVGPRELPPLLRRYEWLPRGKLLLTIDGKWLPRDVGAVPLPVPTRGANALALFLFLFGTDQRTESSTNSIAVARLCDLIGIATTRPSHRRRAVEGAIVAVNKHLKHDPGWDALVAKKLPVRFASIWLRGDRVRFKADYAGAEPIPAEEATMQNADIDDHDGGFADNERRWYAEQQELEESRRREKAEWATRRARLLAR